MQKALFLDRDGVINIEKGYLYKIEEFEFIEGIFELCRYYQNLNYLIVVVTNQSGIDRKYYNIDDFNKLTKWMILEFTKNDIKISKVYFCPHHPELSGICECRKPKAGMLYEAQKELHIDLANSILVGDKERDIEAGLNAGLKDIYLYDPLNHISITKATKKIAKFEEIYNAYTK